MGFSPWLFWSQIGKSVGIITYIHIRKKKIVKHIYGQRHWEKINTLHYCKKNLLILVLNLIEKNYRNCHWWLETKQLPPKIKNKMNISSPLLWYSSYFWKFYPGPRCIKAACFRSHRTTLPAKDAVVYAKELKTFQNKRWPCWHQ